MTLIEFFFLSQWMFGLYFLGLHGSYIILNILSMINIRRYMEEHTISGVPNIYTGLELPISIIVPAYNEELTITDSVLAMLQLRYPEFEVIVVNDGSNDDTLKVLKEDFELTFFPEAYHKQLTCKKINAIYISKKFHNLRVIDKANGGKADALNAGINAARFPLYCAVDADSVLQSNSLERIVQPFLEHPDTIAVGGSVRIANGCTIKKGFVTKANLPKNPLALIQVIEYLRAFLFGRLGWAPLNSLLIISGAFGLFRKSAVVEAGGYLTDCIGEDMELIVRLHRYMRKRKRKYRITFVPDPICWTEAPEDLATLKNQRIRWQRGLSESLTRNLGLMFSRNGGFVGWFAMPYMLLFEWLGPIIELAGLVLVTIGFSLGLITWPVALLFLILAIGFAIFLSIVAVMLEEMSFHIYTKPYYLFILIFVAIFENLGYRQLNSFWRMTAMMHILLGRHATWGKMVRVAGWKKTADKSSL